MTMTPVDIIKHEFVRFKANPSPTCLLEDALFAGIAGEALFEDM